MELDLVTLEVTSCHLFLLFSPLFLIKMQQMPYHLKTGITPTYRLPTAQVSLLQHIFNFGGTPRT